MVAHFPFTSTAPSPPALEKEEKDRLEKEVWKRESWQSFPLFRYQSNEEQKLAHPKMRGAHVWLWMSIPSLVDEHKRLE